MIRLWSMRIIDKDDVLGYGATPEAPIALVEYVKKFYVFPGEVLKLENTVVSDGLIQGLYIRTVYTNVGIIPSDMAVNLITYIDK